MADPAAVDGQSQALQQRHAARLEHRPIARARKRQPFVQVGREGQMKAPDGFGPVRRVLRGETVEVGDAGGARSAEMVAK